MATYLKITGNKEKLMSDFIEQQNKYWFVTQDRFTGIRTVHYNTDDELKIQIEELEKYLQDEKIEFKKTENNISIKSEYVDIYYSSETVC